MLSLAIEYNDYIATDNIRICLELRNYTMRIHPFVRLDMPVFVVSLLAIALTVSSCARVDALQPAVAAADQSSPIIPTQVLPPPTTTADPLPTPSGQTPPSVATLPAPLPYITPTGPVYHFVPPIPRADGHNYDGGEFVTLAEAEAALGHPIRLPSHLPDGIVLKHIELQRNLPAAAIHYSDGIMIAVDPDDSPRNYHRWALSEAEAGRGQSRIIDINGTPVLAHDPGVVAVDGINQAVLGVLMWVDGDLSYVMYTSEWSVEKMIPVAQTMIGQASSRAPSQSSQTFLPSVGVRANRSRPQPDWITDRALSLMNHNCSGVPGETTNIYAVHTPVDALETWLSDGAIAQTADIQGRPAAEVRQEWEAAGITFLGPTILNNYDDVWFVHARGGLSCLPGPGTPPPGGVLPTYDNIFSVLDTNGGMMRGNLTDFTYYTPPLGDLIYSESW